MPSLLKVSLKDAVINLNSCLNYSFKGVRAVPLYNFILNIFLKSLVELGG